MKKFYVFLGFFISILILVPFSAGFAQDANKLHGIKISGNPSTQHRVFIVFKFPPGANEEKIVKGLGGSIRYTYGIVPVIAASIPETAIQGLQNNPNVVAIEAVGQVTATNEVYPWGITKIGSDIVHNEQYNRGFGVKVAIIDTGIDCTHFDLQDNCAGGYDFVNDDYDPYDDHSHGTHVAGIVAADDNYTGIIGVAPDVQLFALKVLDYAGSGWDYDIVAALDWIATYNDSYSDDPIRITNNSYSGSDLNNTTVQTAFDTLASKGVLHVSAAGNSGNVPGRGDNVGYPARFASNIAVAATDDRDKRATFSSTGPDVELSAPGVSIQSTIPGGSFAVKSGTSMASPHVAGVAALVMATGTTDPTEVRNRLVATADDLGDVGKDDKYGWGLVDADEAAYSGQVDTPPVIAITDPIDGAVVKDTYPVIAEATDDSKVSYVTLSINDGTPVSMTPYDGNSWSYDWYTTSVLDGDYILVATATDDATQSTESQAVVVTVNNINDPPIASFTYSCLGLSCDFDAGASSDPDNNIASYSWGFGDEKYAGENVTHTYLTEGSYTVTLTVTDTENLSDEAVNEIYVEEASTFDMHIGVFDMTLKQAGPNDNAIATITVFDNSDSPLEGATVSGTWSVLTNDSDTGVTDSTGTVIISSDKVRNETGLFTFTVESITKDGWNWIVDDPLASGTISN